MPKNNRLIPTLTLVIVIALAFAGGYIFGTIQATRESNTATSNLTAERRTSIGEVWDIILSRYVEPSRINSANLSRGAIEGMLGVLDDPYTSYLNPEQFAMDTSSLEGSYNGIGAYVTVENGQITVIAPITGSPADKAGIRPGDVILQINGEPVDNMNLVQAILKIRGPKDTSVRLLVRHPGETEPVELEIMRTTFEFPSVRFEMKGDIAYINITDFNQRTGGEMATAIQNLKDQQARGIILDLRGNPGGLLDQVVDTASSFLTGGVVVQTTSNQGQISILNVKQDKPKTDLPMVVLVDGNSASGSEVLAGALQDHKRATIAGQKTYGKGSVNILYPLSDGSGLYITTGRWLTPDGRLIEGQGIEPDIVLELTGEDAIQWAIAYLAEKG
jgi:carboxyl-terminal processing protease